MKSSSKLIDQSRRNFKKLAVSIPIQDNHEELLDQSSIERLGLLCEPFWQSADDLEGKCYHAYIIDHPDFDLKLRRSVAERLVIAESLLPDQWSFVIKAGFRPVSVQIALLDALVSDIKRRNVDISSKDALEYARTYVADPRIGCPPHTTGGAVDIDLIYTDTKRPVEMGCPPNTDDERAELHSTIIAPEEYSNRLLLLDAMLIAGFAPLHNEWWHFSYGETRWAAFYDQPHTLYGIIDN